MCVGRRLIIVKPRVLGVQYNAPEGLSRPYTRICRKRCRGGRNGGSKFDEVHSIEVSMQPRPANVI